RDANSFWGPHVAFFGAGLAPTIAAPFIARSFRCGIRLYILKTSSWCFERIAMARISEALKHRAESTDPKDVSGKLPWCLNRFRDERFSFILVLTSSSLGCGALYAVQA
ncbi:unnamed protein product, partial [Phaeothamnion confervicola]